MTKHLMFIFALVTLLGCPPDSQVEPRQNPDPYAVDVGPYSADIRWTSYGIPHILAEDYGSLGYGMGYAFAKDHICTLADQIIKVRSERASYFGAGQDNAHIDSDFGWLGLRVVKQSEDVFLDMPQELQDGVVGYAAGYNAWLEEVGLAGLPEPCAGADWVKPVNHIDLLAYYLHLGQFGSGYPFVSYIGTAQPPNTRRSAPPPPASALEVFLDPPIASNGWAIGREKTVNGKGMLVSNTHFPDAGERQWHESHLTIPGKVNVYGASLMGAPLINIGFNEHVAWTHTVSNTPRFTMYELDLHPQDPTKYKYDGVYEDMATEVVSISVLQDNGEQTTEERTLYRTRFGPMLNAPVAGWSKVAGFTYRDVNEGNYRMSNTFFAMNHAENLDEFQAAHRDHMGIPWVHTLMTDDAGNAFYADSAATPNLSPETEASFEAYRGQSAYASLFWDYGLWVGDGSSSAFEWTEDSRSATPGAIPYDDTPQLLRADFVSNANENYWLANPLEPLTGYPAIYGSTGTPRTPRTKMNNRYLMDTDGRGYAGDDGLWNLVELEHTVMDATGSLADSLLHQVVERCTGVLTAIDPESGEFVDIQEACAVLAAWDGRARVDQAGPILWREIIGSQLYATSDLYIKGLLFKDTFASDNPIYSPAVLADGDLILQAMAKAVVRLAAADIDVNDPLGDHQYRMRGEHKIPVSGAPYFEGVIAVASYAGGGNSTLLPRPERAPVLNSRTGLTEDGYLINNGNSWVMVMSFEEDGPVARAAMTYSQSEDPASPHFKDQSELYSSDTLRDVLFTEEDIANDPVLTTLHLEHPGGSN